MDYSEYLKTLLFICPLVFLAGFVDSIAGGGGLISTPAYLAAGVPPHNVLGCNKFSAVFGASSSFYRFYKSGNIHKETAVYSIIAALIGSYLGSNIALMISDAFLKKLMVFLLPVILLFIVFRRDFGRKTYELPRRTLVIRAIIISFVIGGYDGFFGPGTGTFLIIAFTSFLGFDILKASGNAKAVNWASNVAALFVFLLKGKVIFALVIPAAICNMLGGYIGSGLAISKGLKIIKPIFVVVVLLLLGKIVADIYLPL